MIRVPAVIMVSLLLNHKVSTIICVIICVHSSCPVDAGFPTVCGAHSSFEVVQAIVTFCVVPSNDMHGGLGTCLCLFVVAALKTFTISFCSSIRTALFFG
jgi:hypothetical protein